MVFNYILFIGSNEFPKKFVNETLKCRIPTWNNLHIFLNNYSHWFVIMLITFIQWYWDATYCARCMWDTGQEGFTSFSKCYGACSTLWAIFCRVCKLETTLAEIQSDDFQYAVLKCLLRSESICWADLSHPQVSDFFVSAFPKISSGENHLEIH